MDIWSFVLGTGVGVCVGLLIASVITMIKEK